MKLVIHPDGPKPLEPDGNVSPDMIVLESDRDAKLPKLKLEPPEGAAFEANPDGTESDSEDNATPAETVHFPALNLKKEEEKKPDGPLPNLQMPEMEGAPLERLSDPPTASDTPAPPESSPASSSSTAAAPPSGQAEEGMWEQIYLNPEKDAPPQTHPAASSADAVSAEAPGVGQPSQQNAASQESLSPTEGRGSSAGQDKPSAARPSVASDQGPTEESVVPRPVSKTWSPIPVIIAVALAVGMVAILLTVHFVRLADQGYDGYDTSDSDDGSSILSTGSDLTSDVPVFDPSDDNRMFSALESAQPDVSSAAPSTPTASTVPTSPPVSTARPAVVAPPSPSTETPSAAAPPAETPSEEPSQPEAPESSGPEESTPESPGPESSGSETGSDVSSEWNWGDVTD